MCAVGLASCSDNIYINSYDTSLFFFFWVMDRSNLLLSGWRRLDT